MDGNVIPHTMPATLTTHMFVTVQVEETLQAGPQVTITHVEVETAALTHPTIVIYVGRLALNAVNVPLGMQYRIAIKVRNQLAGV